MATCLTFRVSYQSHVLQDLVLTYTFYSAQGKMPMHAYLALPYFNAHFKCPSGSTLSRCFPQSVIVHWRTRGGKIRSVTLEPISGILGHLIKTFSFFGLHPSIFTSFKWWNKWVYLVLIINRSWAELDTWTKEMATETQEAFNWENTEWPFRIAIAWQRKPMYDPTPFFRNLQYIVPLHHQNTYI